jgi:hypothetical protein
VIADVEPFRIGLPANPPAPGRLVELLEAEFRVVERVRREPGEVLVYVESDWAPTLEPLLEIVKRWLAEHKLRETVVVDPSGEPHVARVPPRR